MHSVVVLVALCVVAVCAAPTAVYPLVPPGTANPLNVRLVSLANLTIRYKSGGGQDRLEYISDSPLGTTRDIYIKDGTKVVHYMPIKTNLLIGCVKSDSQALCDATWTNLGEEMISGANATHWQLTCPTAVAHTATFYEWWLNSAGILVQLKLPNDVLQGNVTFGLTENKGGNVVVEVPTPCRAVDDGRVAATAYLNPNQLFSREWLGCPLDCNSPVHADLKPHPSAICDSSIPAWTITAAEVKADDFTGVVQTNVRISGNLANAANSSKALRVGTCARIDVGGQIMLSSSTLGVDTQTELGTSLTPLVLANVLTYVTEATANEPQCVQLDPIYANCCPELNKFVEAKSYGLSFKCDGVSCSRAANCAPLTPIVNTPTPQPRIEPEPDPKNSGERNAIFNVALVALAALVCALLN